MKLSNSFIRLSPKDYPRGNPSNLTSEKGTPLPKVETAVIATRLAAPAPREGFDRERIGPHNDEYSMFEYENEGVHDPFVATHGIFDVEILSGKNAL